MTANAEPLYGPFKVRLVVCEYALVNVMTQTLFHNMLFLVVIQ